MTDTLNESGLGPETPASARRSTRRTRRVAIIGALALVLVAGAVLVGVTTSGARGGYIAGNSCQNGGACALGNTGPGLGKVFYVATTAFSCGATLAATCFYLEAAPASWNSTATDPKLSWSAAKTASTNFLGNSKTDWHLPTQGELNYLYGGHTAASVSGLTADRYWSSTEDINNAGGAFYQDFDTDPRYSGYQAGQFETAQFYVRPVRAF